MNFSLNQSLEMLSPELQPKAKEKMKRLADYLQTNYKSELRDDSRLAWVYITTLPETELDSIGREIWHTKMLYSYTNYADICKDMLPLVKFSLLRRRRTRDKRWDSTANPHGAFHFQDNPLAKQRTWEHIQNYVIPSIQLECMVSLMEKSGMIE